MPIHNQAPVIVLQHVAAEPPGRIADSLAASDIPLRTVAIHEGDAVPADLGGARGLVIMGGPMGVYEDDTYPHLNAERGLIRQAIEADLPVLGVCLGSQLLASALGARVYASGYKEIGVRPVTLTPSAASDPLFAGLPSTFPALHWHGDVFDLPEGAVHLARSELTPIQAYRFGERAWGLLFHLEVAPDQADSMAAVFAEELAAAKLDPLRLVRDVHRCANESSALATNLFGAFAALIAKR